MLKQAPSVVEIGSMIQNKEVTPSKYVPTPIQQQITPIVDIVQFRDAYNKATNDGYKGKKADFALKLESEGVQVEGFEDYKNQMVKNNIVKDTRKSYFGMVADVIDTRYKNTKKQFARTGKTLEKMDSAVGAVDAMKAYQEQQFSGLTSIATPVAETVGGIVDIALNTLGRGLRAVTPDSVERYVTKQGKEIRDTVKEKEFVKDAVNYLSKSTEEYNEWAINNPDEAQMLSNVMNIADVALIGGGSKIAKEVAEGAGKKSMRLATVDEAKQIVQKKFKAVSDYVKMPKVGETKDSLIDTFASKVGGLRQETIQTIRTNPLYEVAEKGELTRVGFGQEVLSAIEARRSEITELGSLYNNFRNPEIIVDLTPVKQNVKTNILDKYKIKVTSQGLDFRNSKFANDTADQNAIKNAIDLITEDTLPADVALNRRQAISKMARFGSDVSGDGASVVREIRHKFNEQMHKDIKGLKAIDNQIAPEIQQIDSLVSDYYNKDGSLKDSFYSTITNITNKGKELKYDRLNKIIPDIDSRVSALKALEDVENALNQKTGVYEKIAYYGSLFGIGSSVGGPLGGAGALIFGAKYANPQNVVKMLKKRGGAAVAVAEKLETNKALSAFDNEVIEKALRESGEQASDIATRGERRLPFLIDDSIEEVAQQTDNLTPQATQQLDNVASPQASLDELLKNATDEELKANGFTATMIKQFRKKRPQTLEDFYANEPTATFIVKDGKVTPLTKVGTTESATQSIAGKADEVLQEATPMSKVDDALPVGENMKNKLPEREINYAMGTEEYGWDEFLKAERAAQGLDNKTIPRKGPELDIVKERYLYVKEMAKSFKSGEEFYQRADKTTKDILSKQGVRYKSDYEKFFNENVLKGEEVLDNLNPTGGLYVDYNPQTRATMKLGDNITTLDKTMGKSPDEMITIYRGAPKKQKSIVAGDFITTSEDLAKSYAGDGHVISKKVKLQDVLDDINEPLGDEYIYRPQTKQTPKTANGKTLPNVDDGLLAEARKYKSADEFLDSKKSLHRPPDLENGSRLDDLTNSYGDDIYSSNALRYYGDASYLPDKKVLQIIKQAKSNPEMEVTIYRAIEKGDRDVFNPGDWVSLTKEYVKEHGEGPLKGNYKVIEKKVKVKDIVGNADSLQEYGYRPNNHKDYTRDQLRKIREEANRK